MWGHYLLTFYRTMTRHRLYAALNVLGLAVGIAVFLVLWLDVRFETSFERWIPNASQIYNLRTVWTDPAIGDHDASMGALLEELRGDYPQLVGVRLFRQQATVHRGPDVLSERVILADPDFFDVFDLPVIAGEKARALSRPDQMVLTRAEALRYFGSAKPIGRALTLEFGGAQHVYRVAAVLRDPPKTTDLSFDLLVPLTPQIINQQPGWRRWGDEMVRTYLRFDRTSAAEALARDLPAFIDRHGDEDVAPRPYHKQVTLRPQPLLSIHLLNPKDRAVTAGLGAVGLLTLILAAVNYVNLATARATLRAREVALRKAVGATQAALIAQFMAEALATVLFAGLIGLALCELALPAINAAGGTDLRIDYLGQASTPLFLVGVVIVVGLSAGVYPAWVLTRFQPARVLASARSPGGGRTSGRVRQVLVVLQFAVATAFMVATGVIISQIHYLRVADLGFSRQGVINIAAFGDAQVSAAQQTSLLSTWRTLPGVLAVTGADAAPGGVGSVDMEGFKRPGAPGAGLAFQQVSIRPDFFRTYGARLLAGRLLDLSHGADDTPQGPAVGVDAPASTLAHNVVINRVAATALGFHSAADAVGQRVYEARMTGGFNPLTVAGVVDDLRFYSPRDPIHATVYFLRNQDFRPQIAGVRYAANDPQEVISRLRAVWRQVAPGASFSAATVDNNLDTFYRPDEQRARLFSIGSALSVLIGCGGLYGLAAFNTARRFREIGIRKTLGASTTDILRLLLVQVLRPVVIANLIAWPIAYIVMRAWLSSFDQRIALSPLFFVFASVLALAVACATVIAQSLRLAQSEPAKALHHE